MLKAKIKISLCLCAVWSESSLGAFWIAKSTKFLHVNKEYFDQTMRMRRLFESSFARMYIFSHNDF